MPTYAEDHVHLDRIKGDISTYAPKALNEADTRFHIIDRVLKEFLGWGASMIKTEQYDGNGGYIDYLLKWGEVRIVIEAKRWSVDFPSDRMRKKFSRDGSYIKGSEMGPAVEQAVGYAAKQDANLICVTNGNVWGIFSSHAENGDKSIYVLNPLLEDHDGKLLHEILSLHTISRHGYAGFFRVDIPDPNILLNGIRDSAGRLERNNIAEFVMPAIDKALYSDSINEDVEVLEKCYVSNEARVKYDSLLNVHLNESVIRVGLEAKRLKRERDDAGLPEALNIASREHAPPVKLLIGSVGSGKTTYLKHFEQISGKKFLQDNSVRWIYIDFAKMGQGNDPRKFVYEQLMVYIHKAAEKEPDWKSVMLRAYKKERELYRRSLGAFTKSQERIEEAITTAVFEDMKNVDPYVDKVMALFSYEDICILVLDNVDLYENDELERVVFSVGMAMAKQYKCHVLVAMRESTFVAHKNASSFDAYELQKIWLDPPDFREVLSARLAYSKSVLKGKHARIPMANGIIFEVSDLSVYFDILRSSLLDGEPLQFLECYSDVNVRKGIDLIKNFISSGHIQADNAIKSCLTSGSFTFNIHEVFKACMLSQWRYYKEGRAECVNIFSARNGSKKLSLLRLYALRYMMENARRSETSILRSAEIVDVFRGLGASEENVMAILRDFIQNRMARTADASELTSASNVMITRCGAYYSREMASRLHYVEACMFDTQSEKEKDRLQQLRRRLARIVQFLDYLESVEAMCEGSLPQNLCVMKEIKKSVIAETSRIIVRFKARYGDNRNGENGDFAP